MRRTSACLLVLWSAILLGGCFDIEHRVQLNADYSGTADFNFVVNMEPVVLIMAAMAKAFSGDESAPTAAEIEAARADFLEQRATDQEWSFDREQAERDLPEGVRLLSFEPVEDELRFGARIKLAFDHVSRLQEIDFGGDDDEAADPGAASMGPGKPGVLERPFTGLIFTDEGDTMLVTSPADNPLDDLEADNPMADEDLGAIGESIKESVESLRIATSLTLPFEVVEHNATRVDGDTLWWEYDLAAFEERTPEELAQGIRVRFKK